MIAIIGGTGVELSTHPALQNVRDEIIETRWGQSLVTRASMENKEVLFLHRHADPQTKNRFVPPHQINYRAHIAALKKLGATAIFASTAVGSLQENWKPGTLVLLDQIIDFTSNRAKTFYDQRAIHIDVTQPYCHRAREYLLQAAKRLDFELQNGGTYLCCDGPRFETASEIQLFNNWGADVVGMTGAPEVFLAREAEMSYAGVSIVTNLAAGISSTPLTQNEVLDAMKEALPRVVDLFLEASREYSDDPNIPSRCATREFSTSGFEPRDAII